MEYEEISKRFTKGNIIKSLKDGKEYEYKGYLTVVGLGENQLGYDSFNEDLEIYKNGELAKIVEKGINPDDVHREHIRNFIATCKRLGCRPHELLTNYNYMAEQEKTKKI